MLLMTFSSNDEQISFQFRSELSRRQRILSVDSADTDQNELNLHRHLKKFEYLVNISWH